MLVGTDYQTLHLQKGGEMEGYQSRQATGQHDPLTVTALYLKEKNQSFIFISLDLIAIPAFRADRLKRQIIETYELDTSQIIIAAIHTHSGPTVTDLLLDYPQLDEQIWRQIDQAVIVAVCHAHRRLEEAQPSIRYSTVQPGAYGNRNQEHGPYNKQLVELRFTQGQHLIASMIILGSHPTILNAKNLEYSADLVGGIRKYYRLRQKVRPLILLSDCGDTSTRFTRKESSFSEIERISKIIYQSLMNNNRTFPISFELNHYSTIPLVSNYDPITSPAAQGIWQQINKRITDCQDHEEKKVLEGFKKTYQHIRYFGHTHFQTYAHLYEFSAFRIITYPGELVFKLGNQLRQIDQKPTLLITLANDYRGYSVDQDEFGQYFESYNSVLLPGVADQFIARIIAQAQQ